MMLICWLGRFHLAILTLLGNHLNILLKWNHRESRIDKPLLRPSCCRSPRSGKANCVSS